jgi:phosphotransferase system HPr (HPr) family protein
VSFLCYEACVIERIAIVRNDAGIHCRPSAVIIKAASQYAGEITVFTGAGDVDLHSMLALVALGLDVGSEVRIRVTGPDEEAFCALLAELFETRFDFESLSEGARFRAAGELLGDL